VSRSVEERIVDVRRLLAAARAVYDDRESLAPTIARDTGLTRQGVELGFESLEREATDADLRALVAAAGDARRVHVILSANVFTAPLRALALARAASERVTVRPSPRDPTLTHALAAASRDEAVTIVADRDAAAIDAGEIHVYGRAETIAAVRGSARAGVVVRGHGPGLGAAFVTSAADLDAAAEGLARDVVAFDQRGCLSPRVAVVEGDEARAEVFAEALWARLAGWGQRVPCGDLDRGERAEAVRWRETAAFAARVWAAPDAVVALQPAGAPLLVPPPGRHVAIVAALSLEGASSRLAAVAPFVVAVGTDDPPRLSGAPPSLSRARVSVLGAMQRPPLDGPVDRR
jgi:hypothetical protein